MAFANDLLNAPRRSNVNSDRPVPKWRIYRESGDVHEHLAFYTPEDVDEIDDVNTLQKLFLGYAFTGLHHNTKTEYYCRVMSYRAFMKLYDMGVHPPYVVDNLILRFPM